MNPNTLPQLNPAAVDALRAMMEVLQSALAAAPPPPAAARATVQEVGNEFLISKARMGRCAYYVKSVRNDLATVFGGLLMRPIHTVTSEELEARVSAPEFSPRYRRNLICSAKTLFIFAIRRGYAGSNPAAALDLPPVCSNTPRIQTPEEVAAVLSAALQHDLAAARFLAIAYFAGLRVSEVARLDEAEIGPNYIEVKAEKCKTRRRRLVKITPTLRAWLDLGGKLPLLNAIKSRRLVQHAAGVSCPPNAARHCFVSYHLAHLGSASRTALEAGHAEAVLFSNYRELVTPEDAERFWNLRPDNVAEVAAAAVMIKPAVMCQAEPLREVA